MAWKKCSEPLLKEVIDYTSCIYLVNYSTNRLIQNRDEVNVSSVHNTYNFVLYGKKEVFIRALNSCLNRSVILTDDFQAAGPLPGRERGRFCGHLTPVVGRGLEVY